MQSISEGPLAVHADRAWQVAAPAESDTLSSHAHAQWLGLVDFHWRGPGSIFGQGTEIP